MQTLAMFSEHPANRRSIYKIYPLDLSGRFIGPAREVAFEDQIRASAALDAILRTEWVEVWHGDRLVGRTAGIEPEPLKGATTHAGR